MKKLLKNRKAQKFLLPISFVCLIPLWLTLQRGREASALCFVLGAVAVVLFLLDRQLKPWEWERAERRRKEAEEQESAHRAARTDPPEED